MKILIDDNLLYIKHIFTQLGFIVFPVDGYNIPMHKLKSVDALIVRSVTKVNCSLLHDTNVKFIGSATSGTDHLDRSYLVKSGIKFVNASGCNARSVVEYVFSALFLLAKRYNFFLRDKVIGIIGLGNIGRLLYKLLKLFGIETLLCDPLLQKSGVNENWQSLEKLVAEADILTFHVPLKYSGPYSTWHMVNDELLSALPSNRILINTCRGGVVNNNALLQALRNGKKINVVLDVWEGEPSISLALLTYVDIGTPHIAGASVEGKVNTAQRIFNDYVNFFSIKNRNNLNFLTPEKMYHTQLHNKLDEKVLCGLVHSIYNIYYDDLLLRCIAGKIGWFEYFRKFYFSRREWSSLHVRTNITTDMDILIKLGFGKYYFQ